MNLFSIGGSNIIIDRPQKKPNLRFKKPTIASKLSSTGIVYGALGGTASRSTFKEAEYNLGEISKVIDIEAYVRQSFGKHTELCLKEGYELSSRNEEATAYIRKRFREMAEISSVTFDMLLRSVMQNIIAYSNAFVVKVRDPRKSSGRPIPKIAGEPLQPVAAYFMLDPTSMRIKRNFHGKVLKYQQKIPDNAKAPEFPSENIVHFYYDRKEGLAFGTPFIIPALDDIRSLRRMEENIEMLINQHLFPLYHYIVGTDENPAELYDDGTTEVDIIKEQIENMPTEGSIVTPERHEIKNLGAEGKALAAEKYLDYFEKRVLAGLGISEIALGRGGTANRSTADTIDKMMQDRCKDFQDVIEGFVNEFILKELLYEGGFIIDGTEDNFVKLKFNEIDIDNMLKVENHSVFKYEHDAITETELRELLGKDPVADEQRQDMYFERITKPKAIIMAIDEPYTMEAKAGGAIGKVSKEEKKKREATNREKPANQHGSKPAKTKLKKDELLKDSLSDISNVVHPVGDIIVGDEKLDIIDLKKQKRVGLIAEVIRRMVHHWDLTRKDVSDCAIDLDKNKGTITKEKFNMVFSVTKDSIVKGISPYIVESFRDGVKEARKDLKLEKLTVEVDPKFLSEKVEKYIDSFLDEAKEQIVRHLTISSSKLRGIIPTIAGIFDSLRYKIDLVANLQVVKAYNFGYALTGEEKANDIHNNS